MTNLTRNPMLPLFEISQSDRLSFIIFWDKKNYGPVKFIVLILPKSFNRTLSLIHLLACWILMKSSVHFLVLIALFTIFSCPLVIEGCSAGCCQGLSCTWGPVTSYHYQIYEKLTKETQFQFEICRIKTSSIFFRT